MKFLRIFQQEQSQEAGKRLVLMIAIVGIVVFVAGALWQLYQKAVVLREEQGEKEAELAALAKERERLESDIAYLKSDGAIEREAKSRLNYKKTGEEVVIVVPEETAAGATSSAPAGATYSFWGSLRYFWWKLLSR